MRLKLVFLLFVLSHLLCYSAQVVWNAAVIQTYGGSEASVYMFEPYLVMSASRVGTALEIWAQADSNLESANTFVLAVVGDVVDAGYIENRTEWFAYAKYGDDSASHSDHSITLFPGDSVYLAYRIETYNHAAPTQMAPPTYGWIEMRLDNAGVVSSLRSAWDVDGDPIVVGIGAIPEPSSALLLFVGGALLALRRGKRRFRESLKKCPA